VIRDRARAVARRAIVPLRVRPTFLVIGAQKAGTTSLHRYLSEHPAVLCAEPKEVHFFDLAHHLAYGRGWYLSHFPLRTRALRIRRRLGVEPAVGEATPEYLFHPRGPERVHAFDPGLRLIALLRDPVERAYSQYQMQVRKRGETLSFEEALEREETELPYELRRMSEDPTYTWPHDRRRSYVARGRYAEQLERWLSLFPREQLLVLTSEELWTDPAATTSAVSAFLGVPEWRPRTFPHQSAGAHESMAPETRDRLALLFEPHNRRLEELLGRTLGWTRPNVGASTVGGPPA
jgi:hypothetical protein